MLLSFEDRGWEIEFHGLGEHANRLLELFIEDKKQWEWICMRAGGYALACYAPHPPPLISSDTDDEPVSRSAACLFSGRHCHYRTVVPKTLF